MKSGKAALVCFVGAFVSPIAAGLWNGSFQILAASLGLAIAINTVLLGLVFLAISADGGTEKEALVKLFSSSLAVALPLLSSLVATATMLTYR